MLGGTWASSVMTGNKDARSEAGAMFEAAAFSSVAGYALKEIAGRERPYVSGRSEQLGHGRRLVPVAARHGRVRDRHRVRGVGRRSLR